MKNILALIIFMISLSALQASEYNPQTGKFFTGSEGFYRSSSERGNEVVDKSNSSLFLNTQAEGLKLIDTLELNSWTSSEGMLTAGTSGVVQNSKFYTQETKLTKKILDDKFELYGGTVLGASPYVLNNIGGVYNAQDRVAAFASSRGGAKYNLSKSFGLIFEGQYNLTGQMANDTTMFNGFDGANYRGSRMLKTGFEWDF
ncbi:hypothetical protein [Francisella frigiditurris]|uniref:Outer membrane beta-barrel domain protein n=1 Tax=Francisella frigiditurris TaxID=1542390 RepID=A0A1J0KT83_9GAMM|nr:hypothetical protein [Francisella frigiditurris]APC96907.1 hypothetical protein KX01_649 [Francisella frigiditurris]